MKNETTMPEPIESHTLENEDVSVTVLSMGCSVQSWKVRGRPVVLGYLDPEAYRTNPACLGSLCGRVINRISDSRFTLNSEVWTLPSNLAPHHLHGGPRGFAWRNWKVANRDTHSISFSLHSPHLEQGYPGAVDMRVTLTLDGFRLRYEIIGKPDRETILNVGQHHYFNLAGSGIAQNHALWIDAAHCTPTDALGLPTGEILDVSGTRFDFQTRRLLSAADPTGEGYDLNYALHAHDGFKAEMVAQDMRLRLWTDRPGLQLYTSNGLDEVATPMPGAWHTRYGAVCLEAQDFPNAPNQANFGSITCSADRAYRQITTIEICPEA